MFETIVKCFSALFWIALIIGYVKSKLHGGEHE
jgi:hypothetical protein